LQSENLRGGYVFQYAPYDTSILKIVKIREALAYTHEVIACDVRTYKTLWSFVFENWRRNWSRKKLCINFANGI